MKLRTGSFWRCLLLFMFVLLLEARPGNAQTSDSGLAVEPLRSGTEASLDHHESDERAKGLTNDQRLQWFVENTMAPRSAVAGVLSAGLGTGLNRPNEYGRTGRGFAQRYEMRFAGIAAGNAMEATLGAIWKENPRYYRVPNEHFGRRVRNVIKLTFVAYRSDGNLAPAYARYIGIAGNNFLSNSWRAPSEANLYDAALRTFTGFLGRMGSNALQEFWPDVKKRMFHEWRRNCGFCINRLRTIPEARMHTERFARIGPVSATCPRTKV
jgi:hypothetical protein